MLKQLYKAIRLFLFQIEYRKRNKHNKTKACSYFPIDNVVVGKNSYGPVEMIWMSDKDSYVKIGHYVSIGPKVKFLVGGGA